MTILDLTPSREEQEAVFAPLEEARQSIEQTRVTLVAQFQEEAEKVNARVDATLSIVPEVREYAPEDLETENFRVDSTDWNEKVDPNGVRYLENPEGDVTEILDGPYAGQQYFQNDGALERELAKAGKRTMTPEEWDSFAKRHSDWMLENLPLAGNRLNSSAAYSNQGAFGYYWASSPTGTYGYSVCLSATQVFPALNSSRAFGFSVRCLKN